MGCTYALPVMHYGNLWRTHRRLFHRFFNASTASQFDDKIHKAVIVFLHRLSESPKRFLNHTRLYVCPCALLDRLKLTMSLSINKSYRVFGPVDRVRGGRKI